MRAYILELVFALGVVYFAIKLITFISPRVDQSNLEYREKAAGTFNEIIAKGSAPPAHAH